MAPEAGEVGKMLVSCHSEASLPEPSREKVFHFKERGDFLYCTI